ncbi:hypothetical protein M501DRAFT_79002 [Patellaria atrata CBS 101060]|uniref:Uncharacterized protein n=1 Tax=Patellaria atrata CBS 101060 TaxID=1346257 RepID=A0A9P4VTN0_9PEZI|nr:hypothetical protein M501DRAFT_79002 [Patellaria atrata CBS 101060]
MKALSSKYFFAASGLLVTSVLAQSCEDVQHALDIDAIELEYPNQVIIWRGPTRTTEVHITAYPDGNEVTSTKVVTVPNLVTTPLTWEYKGVVLTYPNTYLAYTKFYHAYPVQEDGSCTVTSTALRLPTPVAYENFVYGNVSNDEAPIELIDYLSGIPQVMAQLSGAEVTPSLNVFAAATTSATNSGVVTSPGPETGIDDPEPTATSRTVTPFPITANGTEPTSDSETPTSEPTESSAPTPTESESTTTTPIEPTSTQPSTTPSPSTDSPSTGLDNTPSPSSGSGTTEESSLGETTITEIVSVSESTAQTETLPPTSTDNTTGGGTTTAEDATTPGEPAPTEGTTTAGNTSNETSAETMPSGGSTIGAVPSELESSPAVITLTLDSSTLLVPTESPEATEGVITLTVGSTTFVIPTGTRDDSGGVVTVTYASSTYVIPTAPPFTGAAVPRGAGLSSHTIEALVIGAVGWLLQWI